MLKKDITYKDYNGEEVTETFYFNLTKAELIEIEMSHKGGLEDSLKQMVDDQEGGKIIAEMKKIILMAYGKRSPDGKRFIKNQDLRDEFESTEAYSTLFVSLVTDADAAVAFINGIMPTDMPNPDQPKLPVQDPVRYPDGVEIRNEPRKLTQEEIVAMDNDELKSGLATGRYIV